VQRIDIDHRKEKDNYMKNELEGVKLVEVDGAFAMLAASMLMGSWGADIVHVEPPGKGDNCRHP